MTIRSAGSVLAVDDPAGDSSYIIEPARFELGLSRVEMVDDHLASLRGVLWTEHRDALLDARFQFARETS